MRTNVSTLITLNTVIHLPFRNTDSNSAFFKFRSTCRESSVFTSRKCTNRKIITFLSIHHVNHVTDKFRTVFVMSARLVFQVFPFSRNGNFHHVFSQTTCINSSIVHFHNGFTFLSVWLIDSFFHFANSQIVRNHVCDFKESRLHDRIGTVAQT